MKKVVSAGFDGRRFYYVQGEKRVVLLDAEDGTCPVPQTMRDCLRRSLHALGESALGEALLLIRLMIELASQPLSRQLLLLQVGGDQLPRFVAALLRAHFYAERGEDVTADRGFRAAARGSRLCLVDAPAVGRGTGRRAWPPEICTLKRADGGALPSPERGYEAVLFTPGKAEEADEAEVLSEAVAAAAPEALLLVLTKKKSVLATAKRLSKQGRLYAMEGPYFLYVGRKRGPRPARLPVLELPELRRTMVFLPYKVAMWDCLESIYLAAAADAETLAYVIPIPFADKNPDDTVRAWNYEGNRIPDNIPVIDWRDVSLSRMQPDAIFIHNPFDDLNTVTTVDARYYTPRLKACTHKLVFVPYFVTGGNVYPELVAAPAYHTADHVICENESDKTKFEQCYPWGPPPAGKFLPLGSPKLDKVRTDTRADHPLPAAWERLLAGRRALLYNVTLVAVLHNSAHFLPKLRWVLAQLRRQADVVLWWRPHPLLLSTLQSMRPDLVEAYLSLVQSYRTAGWGIYDDTPDLHRAIAWTDGYYGDYGSMVWLMQAAGRPTLIQNYGLHD